MLVTQRTIETHTKEILKDLVLDVVGLRSDVGQSVAQFSKTIGLSPCTVRRIESLKKSVHVKRGKPTYNPTLSTMVKVSSAAEKFWGE
jgi:hypothetical protein